ncbi:MAG: hypothetical protein IPG71_07720 [bacterium]|nr:hypothetical protein [bacterium]
MRLPIPVFCIYLLLGASASAEDYLRLRDGRIVTGAVIRQDTVAVYLTAWEQRNARFPDLQVFVRDEVESIWIDGPPATSTTKRYMLRPGLFELGGGFSRNTWAGTIHERRFLGQLSLQAGYTISKLLGTEVAADFSLPGGKDVDSTYGDLKFGYQIAAHIVGSLNPGGPVIPFAYVGGGSSLGIPRAGLIETSSRDAHNLIDVGIGLKFGLNGIGVRTELRHAYYTWTPDIAVDDEVRSPSQNADATSLRVSLFTYF